ncbi:hypothetical protein Cni_G22314 [Canna indica]|uniref:Uncharacterized protein n=1 Tax=Canna indica TaxID=4628 RepID=A0AAQ3QJG1_9LILI|nr:hypothetical protein Cni_G22314 [Canna indica]
MDQLRRAWKIFKAVGYVPGIKLQVNDEMKPHPVVISILKRLSILGSSSKILENTSVESMELVVRACVEGLGSASVEAKREAAARIPLLAKHRSNFWALIGASGAIPALIPLLRSIDPAAQEIERGDGAA